MSSDAFLRNKIRAGKTMFRVWTKSKKEVMLQDQKSFPKLTYCIQKYILKNIKFFQLWLRECNYAASGQVMVASSPCLRCVVVVLSPSSASSDNRCKFLSGDKSAKICTSPEFSQTWGNVRPSPKLEKTGKQKLHHSSPNTWGAIEI